MEMDEDVSDRLGFPKRDIDPVPREEMIGQGMVFVGNVPVIEPTSDNCANQT